jgi:HEAT repeat protein
VPYIAPDQYASTSPYDLLDAAVSGFIGFDQRLIHALVDDPAGTLPDIVRFVHAGLVEDRLLTDFIAIFHHLNVPEAAPFYIAAIRNTIDEIPDELTEAVVALGAPMLEPLLALYHDIGEEQGEEVAFMLAGLGVRDQRILDLLLERLEYEAGDGALSLGLYGDPAAIPHIERILAEIPESDPNLRHELVSAIRQIEASQQTTPVPPPPFDIFALYPEKEGPRYHALSPEQRLSLLAGMPSDIRADAAASFRNEDLTRPVRDRLSQVAKLDPDANVRGRAWESLAHEIEEPEIRRSMLAAAHSGPLHERTGAIVALATGAESDEEVLSLIETLYENEPSARAKAVEAMWKSLDRRFQKYMVRHLDDPDPDVRHHAIYGIGYLGVASEAGRLVELFDDEDFRNDALLAYALAVPAEVTRSRMKPLLRRIDQLAGGLTAREEELVKEALDQRLLMHNQKPVFVESESEAEPEAVPKVGRNDPCPCGSGRKYKKCHGA